MAHARQFLRLLKQVKPNFDALLKQAEIHIKAEEYELAQQKLCKVLNQSFEGTPYFNLAKQQLNNIAFKFGLAKELFYKKMTDKAEALFLEIQHEIKDENNESYKLADFYLKIKIAPLKKKNYVQVFPEQKVIVEHCYPISTPLDYYSFACHLLVGEPWHGQPIVFCKDEKLSIVQRKLKECSFAIFCLEHVKKEITKSGVEKYLPQFEIFLREFYQEQEPDFGSGLTIQELLNRLDGLLLKTAEVIIGMHKIRENFQSLPAPSSKEAITQVEEDCYVTKKLHEKGLSTRAPKKLKSQIGQGTIFRKPDSLDAQLTVQSRPGMGPGK